MAVMWSLTLLWIFIGASQAGEVCFDELGCFSSSPPWGGTPQRPLAVLPWAPEQIGTRFLLFTPSNRYYQEIKTDQSIQASNYKGTRRTKFIIPGFLMKGEEDWPQLMCKDMVKADMVNCIAVEWTSGVKTQYAVAANNVRVVAAQVASMITFLMETYRQRAELFHIIGHCIGAHAAGEVGSQIPGLARITGLDPAEPYFQGAGTSVCLDPSDAAFVDVIHTDGLPFNSDLGLGMSQALGHIDFYPNGGDLMPGCSPNKGRPTDLDSIWEGLKKFDACNHVRAYQYYRESIRTSGGFVGYPCPGKDSFDSEACFPCADSQCPLMGYHADKFPTDAASKAAYFLNTGRRSPFSRYSYKIVVTLDGPSWPTVGFMYVMLTGKGSTDEYQLHVGALISGRTYELMFYTKKDVGDVKEVKFRWNNHIVNITRPKFGAAKVELQRGADRKMFLFCGTENVSENEIQSVPLCPSGQQQP